jgi:hypothetical protein
VGIESTLLSGVLPTVLPTEIIENVEYRSIVAWFYQPMQFLLSLRLKTKLYIAVVVFLIIYILYSVFKYLFNKIKSSFNPIRFNLKHVMVIGGSDGLGKEIVREVFMKGALVSIVGRDEHKMKEIKDQLDTSM